MTATALRMEDLTDPTPSQVACGLAGELTRHPPGALTDVEMYQLHNTIADWILKTIIPVLEYVEAGDDGDLQLAELRRQMDKIIAAGESTAGDSEKGPAASNVRPAG